VQLERDEKSTRLVCREGSHYHRLTVLLSQFHGVECLRVVKRTVFALQRDDAADDGDDNPSAHADRQTQATAPGASPPSALDQRAGSPSCFTFRFYDCSVGVGPHAGWHTAFAKITVLGGVQRCWLSPKGRTKRDCGRSIRTKARTSSHRPPQRDRVRVECVCVCDCGTHRAVLARTPHQNQ